MNKHKFKNDWTTLWGMLRYPIPVYKHWLLNNWNYFTKPNLKRKITKCMNTMAKH